MSPETLLQNYIAGPQQLKAALMNVREEQLDLHPIAGNGRFGKSSATSQILSWFTLTESSGFWRKTIPRFSAAIQTALPRRWLIAIVRFLTSCR